MCALVRNDMQKIERRLRLQGRGAQGVQKLAGRQRVQGPPPTVIARSEATGQSVLLAAEHDGKQYFGRIRKALRICPKDYQFVKFPCGDADCRTSVRTGSQ